MEPINTMSGEAIFIFIALAVILVVFGIPLYVVHRRNRNQAEWPDQEQEQPGVEATPVNDVGPQLTQEPAITSDTIVVNPVPVMNPVPLVKPVRKRAEKKVTVAPATEKKPARRSKSKSGNTGKDIKKTLPETAGADKGTPVLSKEFVSKHVLKLDEKKAKSTKKTTKSTKTAKKSSPKGKKGE